MNGTAERAIRLPTVPARNDAAAFVARAHRLDDTAVVRVRSRGVEAIELWVNNGFDVLAVRVVPGQVIGGGDIIADCSMLLAAIRAAQQVSAVTIDPGFGIDSAWRGALPPVDGWHHVDDVPARTVVRLAQEGAEVARNQGSAHGPATSLLDQHVVEVTGTDPDGRDETVAITMRAIFALTSMGFLRRADGGEVVESTDPADIDDREPVRIRANRVWTRVDARYGSVCLRRGQSFSLTVVPGAD
ncbi:hypothetical protein [Williamsia sterculiae]|uniref:Uncharacterized protein n=1 Tax=Williamsia sterculiae TaxID=1344003 RepID=A0A1N7GKF2_9NOCA|nr:hypothetical protein [Williamsia sterculiae]SIS13009.1 hypothetical protein SAMN05445060_2898 [Williamsia sterculiae]